MKSAAPTKVDKELFFTWGASVQRYDAEAALVDPRRRDMLKDNSCGKVTSLRDCLRFLTWLTFEYGTYGKSIFPSEATMAGDYGVSTRTVSRWLTVACRLGIFRKVRDADKSVGVSAMYEIHPWWMQPVQAHVDPWVSSQTDNFMPPMDDEPPF